MTKMASRQGSKSRKTGFSNFKGAADSTASSTTSSSKLYQETSIDDGHSSPASSSAQSKQHFFSPDSVPQSAQRSKENVTVTVRFRPLRFLSDDVLLLARFLFVLVDYLTISFA